MTEDVRREEHRKAHDEADHDRIEAQNILDQVNEDLLNGEHYLKTEKLSMADFLIRRAEETYKKQVQETLVNPEMYADAVATIYRLIAELNKAEEVPLD
jgi:FtsZ-interacting cell division protein YlmF